jgi:hypothetical protein
MRWASLEASHKVMQVLLGSQRVLPLNDLLGFYPSKPSSIALEPVKLVINSGFAI